MDIAILTVGTARIAIMATIGTMVLEITITIHSTMALVQAMSSLAIDPALQWAVILTPLIQTDN
jgi:hypothetical protein